MALQLPEWFVGGFTDTEEALCDYFEWLLGDAVTVCTWLSPTHYAPFSEDGTQPTLRIWRQPGRADSQLRTDEALVQIAAIAPTRGEAWLLIDFVRRMMDPLVFERFPIPRKDGSTTRFTSVEEWLGPQHIPERIVDEKFIPVTFKLPIREPRNLPNYRQILTDLPT